MIENLSHLPSHTFLILIYPSLHFLASPLYAGPAYSYHSLLLFAILCVLTIFLNTRNLVSLPLALSHHLTCLSLLKDGSGPVLLSVLVSPFD